MKKRFLSILMALTMVLSLLPATALAEETTGPQETAIQDTDTTLESGEYYLSKDITLTDGALTVPEGKEVTLNLNGQTLTNKEGEHTIVNKGTLTIVDNSEGEMGTVDNTSHARGAVYNDITGNCTILAGNYTRSKENGNTATENGGNSWYVIKNYGTMTIGQENGRDEDIKVSFSSAYSSLVANGWQE